MDRAKEYASGIMAESSWFLEFKKYVLLRNEGVDKKEIKRRCIEENLFGMQTENRVKRMYGYISKRAELMDDQLVDIFCTSDIATQKLINLICIIKGDLLYFEFANEVYREKASLGFGEIENADVNAFFRKKESEDNQISKWKDSTLRHIRSCYLNFMVDANLLRKEGDKFVITTPIVDIALERYLQLSGNENILNAITGVR